MFEDFLTFFDPEAKEFYDFNKKPEFLNEELAQLFPPQPDENSTKVIDTLVKVFTLEGDEEWILVHVEEEEVYDEDFARRMFSYFYKILDKYQKPITVYALFTDQTSGTRPDYLDINLRRTALVYLYNTYKINQADLEELTDSNNPFAYVILTAIVSVWGKYYAKKSSRDEILLKHKIELAKRVSGKKVPTEKMHILMNFIRNYVLFENPDMNTEFEEQVEFFMYRRAKIDAHSCLSRHN